MSKGPKNIQPSTAKSQFTGVNNYNVGLDGFGSTQATHSGNDINATTSLGSQLQPIYGNATQGLQANSAYLAQDPTQQIHALTAGQNPYYNALKAQNDLNYQTQLSQLQNHFSNNGMQNSTALGAFAGQQARDSNLVDSQNQVSGLTAANSLANQNVATQGNILNNLYNFEGNQNTQAQNGLMNSLQNQDANAQFNAGQVQSANQYNSQAAAQRSSLFGGGVGSVIGAGLGLGATLLTGGAAAPLIMGGVGIGGALGGGGGGQMPGYSNNALNYQQSPFQNLFNQAPTNAYAPGTSSNILGSYGPNNSVYANSAPLNQITGNQNWLMPQGYSSAQYGLNPQFVGQKY